MTPRPIHRWKSLWLGVLVLGFLGWAWVRSGIVSDGVVVVIRDAGTMLWASQSGGSLYFDFIDDGPYRSTQVNTTHEKAWGLKRLPRAFAYESRPVDLSTPAERTFAVAHWFLMVLFLVPWLGFLVWRVRKERMVK